MGASSIPVFVNCWNRVTYARAIVDQVKAIDGAWPIVVDNNSTWPPMKDWIDSSQSAALSPRPESLFHEIPCIIDLYRNIGNYAVWSQTEFDSCPDPGESYGTFWDHSEYNCKPIEIFRSFDFKYYVVTDDDMDLSTVPADVLDVLRELLDTNPDVIKVGLALRIDDLPDSYPLADHVRRFEAPYWEKPLGVHCHEARGIPVYDAPIDTTFAMYRMSDLPTHDGVAWRGRRALRVAGVYTCRHRPWYVGPDEFTLEDWYAIARSETFTQWTSNLQKYMIARGIVPFDFGGKSQQGEK